MSSDVTRALVLAAFAVAGVAILLFTAGPPVVLLNGNEIDIDVIETSGGLAVPLKETSRVVGAMADPGKLGGYVVEWGKTESFYLPKDELLQVDNQVFVNLHDLIRNLEGKVIRSNGSVDIRVPPSQLLRLSLSADSLSLNFDQFTSFTRTQSDEFDLSIRFYNVIDARSFADSLEDDGAYFSEVELTSVGPDQLILQLDLRDDVRTRVVTERGESGFQFLLDFLSDQGKVGSLEGKPTQAVNFSFNTMVKWLDGQRHTIHYLEITEWQDAYRLTPVLANDKVGYRDTLTKLVSRNLGVAGLNANFFDPASLTPIGLVVKNGELLSRDWGNRAAIAIDYFGRLKFFRPDVDLFLRIQATNIPIQGFNRPLSEHDLVAYSHHYGKSIRVSGRSVISVVLQGGRVVSRSIRPPDSVGRDQIVIVGVGRERTKLFGISEGDEAEFDWEMEPYVPLLWGAVSAGPLLIQDGRTILDLNLENFTVTDGLVTSKASRTVLATTSQGHLLFIVISRAGISLPKLPELLKRSGLDIKNAIAFDGGSSSGLAYRDGLSIEKVGGNRRIPVGLVLVPQT